MDIYLAGGYSGNLAPLWGDSIRAVMSGVPFSVANQIAMDIYLAAPSKRSDVSIPIREYLNEGKEIVNGRKLDWDNLKILESYYYLRGNKEFPQLIKYFGKFLLDSGAFTFMSNATGSVDWDAYIDEYAAFINKWNIEYFFELDIDSLVGLKEVERLRVKLEKLTGKKPIPVWHKNRGRDYFIKMCEEYPYVALGGIVSKDIPLVKYEPLFPWFISEAHKRGVKIHGLGYTRQEGLKIYHFDSVDSTAWVYGNISGSVSRFNPKIGMVEKYKAPKGKRLISRAAAFNNFNEWVKYQRYANDNL